MELWGVEGEKALGRLEEEQRGCSRITHTAEWEPTRELVLMEVDVSLLLSHPEESIPAQHAGQALLASPPHAACFQCASRGGKGCSFICKPASMYE